MRPTLARASSSETPAFGPEFAIDGDVATRWSSLFSDPQWIVFDLGAPRAIDRVVLQWEAAHASDYQLHASDGADGPWTLVAQRTNFAGSVDTFEALGARGRYLRLLATRRATLLGHSLWEVSIYGRPHGSCGTARCGNGLIEAGELCDDGHVVSGDGCSATRTLEARRLEQRLSAVSARASSVDSAAFGAALAIDRDPSTRWSSAFDDPQWLEIDLGAARQVSRVPRDDLRRERLQA